MPTLCRRYRESSSPDISARLRPSTMTAPAVGRSSPASRFNRDDFPDPELPSSATKPPAATSREIPSTAQIVVSPMRKWRCTASVRMAPEAVDLSVIALHNHVQTLSKKDYAP